MGIKEQRFFSADDIHKLLSVSYVPTDDGKLWTLAQCHLWAQAAGIKRSGVLCVERDVFRAHFPEVFKKLNMHNDHGCIKHGQYLYAIEFVGVMVKYGYSTSPRSRLSGHVRDGQNFIREIGRIWISEPHAKAQKNELLVKAEHNNKEYIRGADFGEMVARLQALPDAGPGIFLTLETLNAAV